MEPLPSGWIPKKGWAGLSGWERGLRAILLPLDYTYNNNVILVMTPILLLSRYPSSHLVHQVIAFSCLGDPMRSGTNSNYCTLLPSFLVARGRLLSRDGKAEIERHARKTPIPSHGAGSPSWLVSP